jgi:general secretion pathway protein K
MGHRGIQGIRKQQGIALVTAILIVALATITASAMTARQGVDIRRAQNLMDSDQATLYLVGAEDWALQLLERDYEDDPKLDTLEDDWATVLPPIGVEGGQIAGKIEDLNGRFNLNNLVQGNRKIDEEVERFQRLLTILELPPELVFPVMDWIDNDEDPRLDNGAEDVAYLGSKQPYRTSNRSMRSPSELLRVKGFDREVYTKLAPYIYVADEVTDININTASEVIIRSLSKDVDQTAVSKLLEKRAEKPFNNVGDFVGDEVFAGTGIKPDGLSVQSQYFLLTADAQIGRVIRRRNIVVKRTEGKVTTIMRTEGEL